MESTRKKVLGIVGSPRRGGNTEVLVDEILSSAEKAGALTEKVILSELSISPCRACNSCQKGKCVQQDDMSLVLEKMEESQVWVLGTPVYWWGPTAQFKAFLDRWYGVQNVMFEGRSVILVIPLGGSARYANYTVGMLTDALNYLDVNLFATILAPGMLDRGDVRNHADIMELARRVGQEVVQ